MAGFNQSIGFEVAEGRQHRAKVTLRGQKSVYRLGAGWPEVQRSLGLPASMRLRMEPVSRDPWVLRLTPLPEERGARLASGLSLQPHPCHRGCYTSCIPSQIPQIPEG